MRRKDWRVCIRRLTYGSQKYDRFFGGGGRVQCNVHEQINKFQAKGLQCNRILNSRNIDLHIGNEPIDVGLFLPTFRDAFSPTIQLECQHQSNHYNQDFDANGKPIMLTNVRCDSIQQSSVPRGSRCRNNSTTHTLCLCRSIRMIQT